MLSGSLPSDSGYTPETSMCPRESSGGAHSSTCLCLTQHVPLSPMKLQVILPACLDSQRCHTSPQTPGKWDVSIHRPPASSLHATSFEAPPGWAHCWPAHLRRWNLLWALNPSWLSAPLPPSLPGPEPLPGALCSHTLGAGARLGQPDSFTCHQHPSSVTGSGLV